jgi:hypothetical protein
MKTFGPDSFCMESVLYRSKTEISFSYAAKLLDYITFESVKSFGVAVQNNSLKCNKPDDSLRNRIFCAHLRYYPINYPLASIRYRLRVG